MQCIGYILVKNETIKLPVRENQFFRSLKFRKTGSLGSHFSDEEIFLNELGQADMLKRLLNGEVINV